MEDMKNENKTLEQLENDYWSDSHTHSSRLIEQAYAIRKKRLAEMNSNDLRLMISQGIGLKFLIPKAIRILKKNVLEDALYYPGDLLLVVLKVSNGYWETQQAQRIELADVVSKSKMELVQAEAIHDTEIKKAILSEIERFLKIS